MNQSMLSTPEYKESNDNIYLTLRNPIKENSGAVHKQLRDIIEQQWTSFNDTQRSILRTLFLKGKATLAELATDTEVNPNTLRVYLNTFIDEGILEKQSTKKRDINANYVFKRIETIV